MRRWPLTEPSPFAFLSPDERIKNSPKAEPGGTVAGSERDRFSPPFVECGYLGYGHSPGQFTEQPTNRIRSITWQNPSLEKRTLILLHTEDDGRYLLKERESPPG